MKEENLKQIFWDVDDSKLNTLSDENIIKRSISFGTLNILKDMFADYTRSDIRNIFLNMNPKTTTERRYNYFRDLLSN